MLSKLLLLLALGTTWSLPDHKVNPRIFHGYQAEQGQFPWQAALFIPTNSNLRFCGGAIISEEWVLTAAHCLNGAYFSVRVLVGTTKSTGDDPDQLSFHARQWVQHPEYDPWAYEGDLALVKLPQALVFNDYIKPIKLGDIDNIKNATVSGWGDTGNGERSMDLTFATVEVEICSNGIKICSSAYNESEAQNICGGDSGGALVINAEDDPVHVGVASTYSGTCGKGQLAQFTRTASYLDWIQEVTGILIK